MVAFYRIERYISDRFILRDNSVRYTFFTMPLLTLKGGRGHR